MKKVLMALMVWVGFFAQAQDNSVLTNGLVAFYPFNGNASDAVGTNNGTVVNAVLTTNRYGIANSAYSFNGTSAYIDCGNKAAFTVGTNDFTLSAWVLLQGAQADKYVVGKYYQNVAGSYGLGTATSVAPYAFMWGTTNASYIGATGPSTLNDGHWHQLTAVFQRSGKLSVYRDGVLNAQATISSQQGAVSNTYSFQIGRIASGAFFGGLIDDVRFYKRALATNEVSQLYDFDTTQAIVPKTAVEFDWNGLLGQSYQFQTSADLTNWTNIGSSVVGTGTYATQFFSVTTTNLFFRLKLQ